MAKERTGMFAAIEGFPADFEAEMDAVNVLAVFGLTALDLTPMHLATLVFSASLIAAEFFFEIIGFETFGLLCGAFAGAFLRHDFLARRTNTLVAILLAVMDLAIKQFSAFLTTEGNWVEAGGPVIASEGGKGYFFARTMQ